MFVLNSFYKFTYVRGKALLGIFNNMYKKQESKQERSERDQRVGIVLALFKCKRKKKQES